VAQSKAVRILMFEDQPTVRVQLATVIRPCSEMARQAPSRNAADARTDRRQDVLRSIRLGCRNKRIRVQPANAGATIEFHVRNPVHQVGASDWAPLSKVVHRIWRKRVGPESLNRQHRNGNAG